MTDGTHPPGTPPAGGAQSSKHGGSQGRTDDEGRWNRWSFGAVIAGVIALTAAFFAILLIYTGSIDDPVGAFGIFATPVVSVVTAYFGISASSKANAASLTAVKDAIEKLKS